MRDDDVSDHSDRRGLSHGPDFTHPLDLRKICREFILKGVLAPKNRAVLERR